VVVEEGQEIIGAEVSTMVVAEDEVVVVDEEDQRISQNWLGKKVIIKLKY
jgi:hypothetical protein